MQKALNILLKLKDFILAISAITVVLLNIWLGSKLDPIIKDIGDNTVRVSANEDHILELKDNSSDIRDITVEIREDVSFIRGTLEK